MKIFDDAQKRKAFLTCPSCGSLDIHLFMGGETGIQYKCETCGYHGPFIVERDIGKNMNDTSGKSRKFKR